MTAKQKIQLKDALLAALSAVPLTAAGTHTAQVTMSWLFKHVSATEALRAASPLLQQLVSHVEQATRAAETANLQALATAVLQCAGSEAVAALAEDDPDALEGVLCSLEAPSSSASLSPASQEFLGRLRY